MMAESDTQELLTSTPVILEENSPEKVTVMSSAPLPPPVAQPQAAQPLPLVPTRISPHSYLIFSTIVAIFCGIFNMVSITCTIPAVTMSVMSHLASKRGEFAKGRFWGNASLVLSVIAIVAGFVMYFAASLYIVLLFGYFYHCGFSGNNGGPSCERDIF